MMAPWQIQRFRASVGCIRVYISPQPHELKARDGITCYPVIKPSRRWRELLIRTSAGSPFAISIAFSCLILFYLPIEAKVSCPLPAFLQRPCRRLLMFRHGELSTLMLHILLYCGASWLSYSSLSRLQQSSVARTNERSSL